jgi:hypothetical protein
LERRKGEDIMKTTYMKIERSFGTLLQESHGERKRLYVLTSEHKRIFMTDWDGTVQQERAEEVIPRPLFDLSLGDEAVRVSEHFTGFLDVQPEPNPKLICGDSLVVGYVQLTADWSNRVTAGYVVRDRQSGELRIAIGG